MGKKTSRSSIASAIAWGWALEALASSKNVAVSLLHDLIATIPANLPDKLRRSVNERVALRCLEELFSSDGAPPIRRPKLSLDLSESCEEVLKRILNESAECDVMMGGGGRWKWDVEPFIKHKRASMPKCALEKLKESIVDGSHPHAELFAIKSGLASVRAAGNDGILRFDGGCSNAPNIGVKEEKNDESVMRGKRGRIELETGKVADDGLGVNAKKVKRDASCVLPIAEENPVPSGGRQMMERSLERDIPVSARERCVLSEFRMEIREERLVEDPCVAPSQRKVSAKDLGCNIDKEFPVEVPQTVSVGGSKKENIADEGKDNSLHLSEPTTPRVAPPDKAQHKESNCNSEHDSHIKITSRASAEVSQKKNFADGAKDHSQFDYVAMEKRDFLNSKCALTRYFNSTEKDHCLMCNGGGELLICSASDCPLVYHESCMGSKFISYVSGDFYCPYCAYSLHLTEFLELENEALRLTKDLDSCIRLLEVIRTGISEEN